MADTLWTGRSGGHAVIRSSARTGYPCRRSRAGSRDHWEAPLRRGLLAFCAYPCGSDEPRRSSTAARRRLDLFHPPVDVPKPRQAELAGDDLRINHAERVMDGPPSPPPPKRATGRAIAEASRKELGELPLRSASIRIRFRSACTTTTSPLAMRTFRRTPPRTSPQPKYPIPLRKMAFLYSASDSGLRTEESSFASLPCFCAR